MKRLRIFLASISLGILCVAPQTMAGSLSIEPIREELTLKTEQSIDNQLIVRNSTDKPISVSLEAESFSVINESYDYGFTKAEDLKSWVRFNETSVQLPAKESHLFTYTVSAPQNAEPGGKYIAIFSTTNSETKNAVTSLERAGTLLYITIPGAITKIGTVVDARTPTMNFRRQINSIARIRNTGSAHFKSRTKIEVRNIFGGFISSREDEHLLLPNTVRAVEEPVLLGKFPGLYRIRTTIGLGDTPAHTKTQLVWYVPFLPTTFLSILVMLSGRKIVRLLRKRKQN